ncbi:hypothetical protein ILUMI_06969 [Ignelater luminosus]|uniref:Uncharacterized protein n=1 Tax=Ignelater luminosus TaxID=2038154 RepID=A0A8K0D8Z1_IGNLU|nr:hypothetical protein ILUMI_06969 [Ignelater luminosus]
MRYPISDTPIIVSRPSYSTESDYAPNRPPHATSNMAYMPIHSISCSLHPTVPASHGRAVITSSPSAPADEPSNTDDLPPSYSEAMRAMGESN